MKECVTHHYACDCREVEIKALLSEIYRSHSDPNDPGYNECDKGRCFWCERVVKLYGEPPWGNEGIARGA